LLAPVCSHEPAGDDLLEHGRLIDLFAQGEVFVLQSILQPLDLVDGRRRLGLAQR
jgi:hypothetical protein